MKLTLTSHIHKTAKLQF